MKRSQIIKAFIAIALLFLTFPKPAHAYVDLGTGSYLLQVAIASLLAGFWVFRSFFEKLTRFRKTKENDDKKNAES